MQFQYTGDSHTYITLSKGSRAEKVKVVNGEIIEIPDKLYPVARLLMAGFKLFTSTKDAKKDEETTAEVVEKPKKAKKTK